MEAGVGAAALASPAYRSSDHYGVTLLPFPYFVYRGERLKLSREGVRLRALKWANFTLGVSGAITLPGNRGEDPARERMPRIDPTLEFGPSLDWTHVGATSVFCVCIPVRAVAATDFSNWRPAGWLAHPQLRLTVFADGRSWAYSVAGSLGPVFANRRYHGYFFDVGSRYVTPERPAYEARGGYSGTRGSLFLGARADRWGLGLGIVADALGGAAFADSPLVKTRSSVTVGIGITYSLWRAGTASVEDDAR